MEIKEDRFVLSFVVRNISIELPRHREGQRRKEMDMNRLIRLKYLKGTNGRARYAA
jgi:hypothetical protein